MNDRRRRTTSVVAAAFVLAMIPALATAGHDASTVASYTGCLSSRGGAVYNLAEGQTTSGQCKSGDTQVHLSGGDITGVLPGDGLIGGATEGTASLAVDTAVIQTRVAEACAMGSAIREIAGDGAVTCEEVEGTDVSQPGGDGTAIHGSHLQDASVELVKLAADVLTEAEFEAFISRLATPTSADDVVFLVDASRIGGTLGNSQIPDLDASKIASGRLDPARLPIITGSMVTTIDADGLTGSNIHDGSISTHDLASSAVTTAKQSANVSGGLFVPSALDATPRPVAESIITNPDPAPHKVLVTGNAVIACTTCSTTDVISWQVTRNGTAIGSPAQITGPGSQLIVPVSVLDTSAEEASGSPLSPGVSKYELMVTYTGAGDATNTAASLVAVDLGR